MSESTNLPSCEQLLASAAQFLIDGQELDAASVLLACTLELEYHDGGYAGNHYYTSYDAVLSGPRGAFDAVSQSEQVRAVIRSALNAVLPLHDSIEAVIPRATVMTLTPDGQAELLDIARGKHVHNQGVISDTATTQTWHGLRFGSESERRIAEALDTAGVMYLANCKARLGIPSNRVNRIPDFVVCCDGKWGILEVDGAPHHPASRKAQEDEKDRLLKRQGIMVIEHFDATRCLQEPDAVVQIFLDILKRA